MQQKVLVGVFMYDIAIIGGGAAGMFAAICIKLKNKNLKVIILDGEKRLGKKLLATGNGRCNLSNENISADKYYSSSKNFIKKALENVRPSEVLDIWHSLGLLTRSDSVGRIYPYSMSANSVLDVLLSSINHLDIKVLTEFKVKDIFSDEKAVKVSSENKNTILAKKAVLSCGGASLPSSGSDGSSCELAKKLGLKVKPYKAALAKLYSHSPILQSLAGIRIDAVAKLIVDNKEIMQEKGQVQFTKDGLSGICIFNLSVLANLYPNDKKYISLNLMPEYTKEQVIKFLNKNKKIYQHEKMCDILQGIFVKRISQALVKTSGIQKNKYCCDISKDEILSLASNIIDFRFYISKLAHINDAQVSFGGVEVSQVDYSSMRCKDIKNIYICGEMLDVVGFCGGYNLHWAWLSAILAAKDITS